MRTSIRNFIAVMFPSEPAAYEGLRALKQLHADGTITLYDHVVVAREPSGKLATRQYQPDERPLRRVGIGALVGALAGAMAGPIGAVFGGAVGVFGGALDEAVRDSISAELVDRIAARIQP